MHSLYYTTQCVQCNAVQCLLLVHSMDLIVWSIRFFFHLFRPASHSQLTRVDGGGGVIVTVVIVCVCLASRKRLKTLSTFYALYFEH